MFANFTRLPKKCCGFFAAVRWLLLFTGMTVIVFPIALGVTVIVSLRLLDKESRVSSKQEESPPPLAVETAPIEIEVPNLDMEKEETVRLTLTAEALPTEIEIPIVEVAPITYPSWGESQDAVWQQISRQQATTTWQKFIELSLRLQYAATEVNQVEPSLEVDTSEEPSGFEPLPPNFREWTLKQLQKKCRELNALALKRDSDNLNPPQIRGHSSKNIKPSTLVFLIEKFYEEQGLSHLIPPTKPATKRKRKALAVN